MTDVLISTSNTKTNGKETYMSKMFKVGMVGLVVVGVLAALMVGSALAQEPTPPDPLDRPLGGWGRGGFGRFGGDRWTMFDATAEALGLTPEGLFAELHAGKSLAEVAEAQGVDTEALQDAMHAARVDAIQQAVEDGTLTQEQADRLLDRLENMPSQEELTEAKKQAIQQAVEEGRISQEQADWMLEGLENGYWGGHGFGGHGGGRFGGFRGVGGFDSTRGAGRPSVPGIGL
jgi:polyhydroxyalkanoate synthesis regulator phasin